MIRYFSILAIWCLAWYLPSLAGPWWDYNLQVYNALVSAFLIFAVLKIHRCGWTLDLATICALQIVFNMGDLFLDMPAAHYNSILTLFNGIEIGIILFLGGPRELYRKYHVKHHRDGNHSGPLAKQVADGIHTRKEHA